MDRYLSVELLTEYHTKTELLEKVQQLDCNHTLVGYSHQ